MKNSFEMLECELKDLLPPTTKLPNLPSEPKTVETSSLISINKIAKVSSAKVALNGTKH